jgi:hypothetical protein
MTFRSNARFIGAACAAYLAALAPSVAFAQDATTTPPPPPPPPAAPPPPVTTATATPAGTDHSRVVGHLAVGFMGVNGVPIGLGGVGPSAPGQPCGQTINGTANTPCRPVLTGGEEISAPTIGVRYWINDKIGVDAGLGIGIYSGSAESYPYSNNQNGVDIKWEQDRPTVRAFVIHGGVPLALAEGQHYTFEVIPEANVGFASGTVKQQPQPPIPPAPATPTHEDVKLGGFRLDVGARAGAEIHMGFIGVPELSLVGSVGLYFSTQTVRVSAGGKDAKESRTAISTTVQEAPWGLFTKSIAALYYF